MGVYSEEAEENEAEENEAEEAGDEGEDEPEDPMAIMAEYDKDKDGKLSLAEIAEEEGTPEWEEDKQSLEIIKAAFKKADADGDDKIGADEIEALLQILKEGDEEL